MKKLSIGITGGIGSGKSTVTSMLAACGATVVDADAVSRSLTAAQGLAIPHIRRIFGEWVVQPDGAMNRAVMRDLIFSDSAAKEQLEQLLHPMIKAQTQAAFEAATGLVVVDVPLLVEGNRLGSWRSVLDQIWVVDCEESTQISRVQTRSQLGAAQIESIMAAQATRERRLRAADAVLYNDGVDLAELKSMVLARGLVAAAHSGVIITP